MPYSGKASTYKRDFLCLSSTVLNPLFKVFCNRTMYSKVDKGSNFLFYVVLILDKMLVGFLSLHLIGHITLEEQVTASATS